MLMKSVPPVLASARRHIDIASPFTSPPNTLFSSGSVASGIAGSRSVSTLVITTASIENSAKRLPM